MSTRLLEILDHEEFDECPVKLEAADITQLQILINKTLDDESGKCHIEISDREPLVKIDQALDQLKTFSSERSRTAKLWVQFMDDMRIIQDFIATERLAWPC